MLCNAQLNRWAAPLVLTGANEASCLLWAMAGFREDPIIQTR